MKKLSILLLLSTMLFALFQYNATNYYASNVQEHIESLTKALDQPPTLKQQVEIEMLLSLAKEQRQDAHEMLMAIVALTAAALFLVCIKLQAKNNVAEKLSQPARPTGPSNP